LAHDPIKNVQAPSIPARDHLKSISHSNNVSSNGQSYFRLTQHIFIAADCVRCVLSNAMSEYVSYYNWICECDIPRLRAANTQIVYEQMTVLKRCASTKKECVSSVQAKKMR